MCTVISWLICKLVKNKSVFVSLMKFVCVSLMKIENEKLAVLREKYYIAPLHNVVRWIVLRWIALVRCSGLEKPSDVENIDYSMKLIYFTVLDMYPSVLFEECVRVFQVVILD